MKKPVNISILWFFSLILLSLLLFLPHAYGQDKVPAYVGSNACKECHQEYYDSYMKSIHAKKAIPGSPAAGQACESCHGPGDGHAKKGGEKGLILAFGRQVKANKKSAACLSCHENSKELTSWNMGRHKTMDVSCDNCHAVHSNTRKALKASEPALCLPCHKEVRNQINRQSRHPIQAGKVKCTDCHTPHGGFGPKMIKADSTTDLCYKCHAEKRGPFAFEHPPVSENCATCHQVHGSNHNNLLVSKTPQLCQSCHNPGFGHTSRAYTLQHSFSGSAAANMNKFYGQGCLNCHGNIHGSNRSPNFER